MAQIQTAAILIIGDEILNGKIRDTNSHHFANTLFEQGVEVKRIVVVGDYEQEIIEAVRKLESDYDLVVTSGGIGPTLDDITYESVAKAFHLPTMLHKETVEKMKRLSKSKVELNEEEQDAQNRMAIFPTGPNTEELFLDDELWVPVVGINSKVFILPGIPQLFQKLLRLLVKHLKGRISEENKFIRYFIKTQLSESQISPYMKTLQAKADLHQVKIGSYPHMDHDFNTVSILGRNRDNRFIRSLVDDALINFKGEEIDADTERKYSDGPFN